MQELLSDIKAPFAAEAGTVGKALLVDVIYRDITMMLSVGFFLFGELDFDKNLNPRIFRCLFRGR